MDPLDHLRLLRRRWWLVAAVLGLALTAAYVTLPSAALPSQPLAASYTATHTLLQSPDEQQPINLNLTKLFATTGQIPEKAAARLGLPPAHGPILASRVQVTVDPDVAALRLSVIDGDGARAARTANAFAVEVLEFLRSSAQTDRDAEAAALQEQLAGLSEKVLAVQAQLPRAGDRAPLLEAEQAAFTSSYQTAFARLQALQDQGPVKAPLTTLQEAVPVPNIASGSPVPTSRSGRLGLAGLLGLVLGVGLVLAIDRLDTRVRSREQAEEASRLTVVAEIPRLERRQRRASEIVMVSSPGGAVAESYRALRTSLLLVPSRPIPPADEPGTYEVPSDWRPPQVVLVTSAWPSEGKTSTVVNLAASLAESGRSVLVLDADFRKPAANRYLGVQRSAGLSELLSGGLHGGVASAQQDTIVAGVGLVTSGSSTRHPAALLSRVGAVVEEARRLADFVIIDSAPLLVANDAADIVPHVDTVLVVGQVGRSTRPQAERTSELLSRLGVPVLGLVLQASPEAGGLGGPYDGSAVRKGLMALVSGRVGHQTERRPSTTPAEPAPRAHVRPPEGEPRLPRPVEALRTRGTTGADRGRSVPAAAPPRADPPAHPNPEEA